MSQVSHLRPISEFLIVGCDHGWLGRVGYDRKGIRVSRDSRGIWSVGSFLVRNLLYLGLSAGKCRNGAIEWTGSNGETFELERRVAVQGGERRTVDFLLPPSPSLLPPAVTSGEATR